MMSSNGKPYEVFRSSKVIIQDSYNNSGNVVVAKMS
jgi:hypothetical protein